MGLSYRTSYLKPKKRHWERAKKLMDRLGATEWPDKAQCSRLWHCMGRRRETADRAAVASDGNTHLVVMRDANGWKKVGAHGGELIGAAVGALALPVCRTDQSYDVNELESCDAGLTECDALVAQTGSVLVTSRSSGGRALSVLPPHHVVLARRDQLLRDLPAAFQLLKQKYGANYPSLISLITGPSRTGDIERILVLGAHGPKKLTVVLV